MDNFTRNEIESQRDSSLFYSSISFDKFSNTGQCWFKEGITKR